MSEDDQLSKRNVYSATIYRRSTHGREEKIAYAQVGCCGNLCNYFTCELEILCSLLSYMYAS